MTRSEGTENSYQSIDVDQTGEHSQLTGRDIFKVLFRRKWIILVLFFSTTFFVVWHASQIPTAYTATAEVLIQRGQRKSALDRNISLLTWDETVSTELQIAESRPVMRSAQAALDSIGAAEGTEPIQINGEGVRSVLLNESNVVGIRYSTLVEAEAQPVANAIAQAYIAYHKKLFALPDATRFFSDRVKEAEINLHDLTERRQRVQEDGVLGRIQTQQDQMLGLLRELRRDLAKEELALAALRVEVVEARRMYENGDVDIPFHAEKSTAGIQVALATKQEVNSLILHRDDLLTKYTERHPMVLKVNDQIARLRKVLNNETEQLLELRERSLKVNEAKVADLRMSVNQAVSELQALPAVERELHDLERSIELASDAYAELLQNQVKIQVAEVSSRDFNLSLLSEAGAPVATNPRDPVRLALVPLFSLLVGLSLAFFIETMDHSLKSREDVERYLELGVLASIPNRKRSFTS